MVGRTPHWTLAAALRSWRFWTVAGVFVTGSYALGLWVTALTAVCAPALLRVAAPRRPNPPPR
jgi:hypothetical protein